MTTASDSARLSALQQTTELLRTARGTEDVAASVARAAYAAFEAYVAGVYVYDAPSATLVLSHHEGFGSAAKRFSAMPLSSPAPIAQSFRLRKAIYISSLTEYRAQYPQTAQHVVDPNAPLSFACLPLFVGTQNLGVLTLAFRQERTFGEEERRMLQAIAGQASIALERAELEQAGRRAAERLSFLAEATKTLNQSLALEETLQAIAGLMIPTHADYCFFDVKQDDGTVRRIARVHDNPDIEAILSKSQWVRSERTDMNLCALSTGEPALHAEIDDAWRKNVAVNEGHLAVLEAIKLGSMITVPVYVQNELEGALTICMGPSGRRYSEADLVLAREAAERASMALHHAKLYEQAQTAIRARDEFLAIASHELNTPLTALKLHAQRLQDASADKLPSIHEAIVKQTERITRLVKELLDVSRIHGGRLSLRPESFDFADLLKDVAVRHPEASIALEVNGDVRGSWDRVRMEQVVQNLISNAVKYGGGKPVKVQLSAQEQSVRLVVRDEGIGIAPEERARLFKKFERLSSARGFGGFGLGLWITRQVVDAHGGEIVLSSEHGQGTSVKVELPRVTHRANS